MKIKVKSSLGWALALMSSSLLHADYRQPSGFSSIPTESISGGSGAQGRILSAIEDASGRGVRLQLGAGSFNLGGIIINKNNIFIECNRRTVLNLREDERLMFHVGTTDRRVVNFGFTGPSPSRRCTVNLSPNDTKGFDEASEFLRISHCDNFLIRNINILDAALTRRSSIWVIQNETNDSAREGTIRDIFQASAHRGYGNTQIYRADNCVLKNISANGGVPLRLETGQFPGTVALINCDGDNIRCVRGQSTVVYSPHWADSRGCQVTNIVGASCFNSVRVAGGFFNSRSPLMRVGSFRNSSVDTIRSNYGMGGQENIFKVARELIDDREWDRVRSRVNRAGETPRNRLTRADVGGSQWVVAPTSAPVYSFERDVPNANRDVQVSGVTRRNYPGRAFGGNVLGAAQALTREMARERTRAIR